MTLLPHPTADSAPTPVLFNAWKHHAGWVRDRVVRAATQNDLCPLASEIIVVGTKLMDFYTGTLSPWEVGEQVLHLLHAADRLSPTAFAVWVAASDGYQILDLSDGSRWVVRGSDGERYVHLHPARYSPHTVRVSGHTLKTAIVSTALALTRGQPAVDLRTVNDARREHLALPPIGQLPPSGGLGEVLQLLAVATPPAPVVLGE